MTQIRSLCAQIGFTIIFLLMHSTLMAGQVDCKLVTKAMEAVLSRTLNIPTHAYVTSKIGSHTFETEMIYVDGSLYLKSQGQWTLSNSDLKQAEEQVARNPKSKDTCRYLGDEPVSGETAAKYSLHGKSRNSKSDKLVWISKARGLVLREEMELGNGNVLIMRYEYDDVKPPL